jgi:hypothetical protein
MSWERYKGVPPPDSPFDAFTMSKAVAHPINFEISGKRYLFWVEFVDTASWVKRDTFSTSNQGYFDYVAEHEKYHYYISVLSAKKWRKYVLDNHLNTDIDVKKAGEQFHIQQWNDNYDSITKHGSDPNSQKAWEQDFLKQWDEYKNIRLDSPVAQLH